ncbi:basic helix-loop-helix transcription factor scleraxis-like [Oppia nitens]|uniref:basic helix-loop-helix transcription factor scleraxis-like n=1 Tax=Oppia nitens TaxID=1686743 RepID=UPI0023DC8987|nr:basic helix-loop-helix transcription factor scleraxis-like [Oppia nitens]
MNGNNQLLTVFRSKGERRFDTQIQRQVANARERDRTESVNSAFIVLRSLIPTDPPNRKLSKIETLRLAVSYIKHLNNVRNALFNGEESDNICVRNARIGSLTAKTICTFCITNQKSISYQPYIYETSGSTITCCDDYLIAEQLDKITDNMCDQLFPQLNEFDVITGCGDSNSSLSYFNDSSSSTHY